MKQSVSCPKCHEEADVEVNSGELITCPACGALFPANQPDDPDGDDSDSVYRLQAAPEPPKPKAPSRPQPRPEGSASGLPGTPKKKKKKKKSGAPARRKKAADNQHVLIFSAGVAVVLLVVLGIVFWGSGGDDANDIGTETNQAAATHARGEFFGTGIESEPVVLDTPVENVSSGLVGEIIPSFKRAEPFDEAAAAQRLDKRKAVIAAKQEPESLPKPPSQNAGAHWKAQADPPPGAATEPLAADLKFEFVPGKGSTEPVLADLNGPFALVPAAYTSQPFNSVEVGKEKVNGRTEILYKIEETPQSPVPVIDLRTGQRAGEFDWRVPFWAAPALSPDGKFLIGPYYVPHSNHRGHLYKEYDKEQLNLLYLWTRDSSGLPRTLELPGIPSWYGFAGHETILILVETPARQLQIWDASSGTQRSAIDLPNAWRETSQYPDDRWKSQRPWRDPLAAVSPGGRFVAVAGGTSIAMISIAEEKVLGMLDVELRGREEDDFKGLSFSARGDRLLVAHRPEHKDFDWTRILLVDAADGRLLKTWDHKGRAYGPLFLDHEGTSCIHGGMTVTFNAPAWLVDFDRQRDGILLDAQRVVRWPAAGPALVIRAIPGQRQQTLLAVSHDDFQAELAVLTGDPVPNIEFDPEPDNVVQPAPPETWQPLPEIAAFADGKYDIVPGPPWLTSCSDETLAVLDERPIQVGREQNIYHYSIVASVRRVDRATGAPLGPPVVLREWRESSKTRPAKRMMVFGMSPDAERFVTRDPLAFDRVELWTSDGQPLFSFAPSATGDDVEWAGFSDNETLLVAGGGGLSAWKVGPGSCQCLYRTSGGSYTIPCLLTPGRKLLFVSRNHSVDVLDAATGKCLNRLGIKTDGHRVCDVAVSPDGRSAAILYVPFGAAERVLQHPVYGSKDGANAFSAVVALWDMQTGSVQQAQCGCDTIAFLTWIGNEHLCVGSKESVVFDMRSRAMALRIPNGVDGSVYLNKSCDGRIWRYRGAKMLTSDESLRDWSEERADDSRLVPIWLATTLTGEKTAAELPFFADDRDYVSLIETPIVLALDLADARSAEKNGQQILSELQARGFKIGPAGSVLSIRPHISSSQSTLQAHGKATPVPSVEYVWEIRDPQGQKVWSDTTVGNFDFQHSKYIQRGGTSTEYDFGRKGLQQAVVQEILANGAGLEKIPEIPQRVLSSGGELIPFPQTLNWTLQPLDAAGDPNAGQ